QVLLRRRSYLQTDHPRDAVAYGGDVIQSPSHEKKLCVLEERYSCNRGNPAFFVISSLTFPRCGNTAGFQIQYNLSRIHGWCKAHQIGDSEVLLEQLVQVVKLLQMPKGTIRDLDNMFEACFLLNATQIKKILTIYCVADYDAGVNPELIKAAAARVSENDALLLDAKSTEEAGSWKNPTTKKIESIERYVPMWLTGLIPNTNAVEKYRPAPQRLPPVQLQNPRQNQTRNPGQIIHAQYLTQIHVQFLMQIQMLNLTQIRTLNLMQAPTQNLTNIRNVESDANPEVEFEAESGGGS
ncbi:MAG: DIL domain-containing protein, partial [Olpidium bornovanus]